MKKISPDKTLSLRYEPAAYHNHTFTEGETPYYVKMYFEQRGSEIYDKYNDAKNELIKKLESKEKLTKANLMRELAGKDSAAKEKVLKELDAKNKVLREKEINDLAESFFTNYPLFSTQNDLIDRIKHYLKIEKPLFQSSISTTLKNLLYYDLIDCDKNRYGIVKTDTKYIFVLRNATREMVPLYEAKNIFSKESVHRMSDNTLVFKLIKDSTHLNDFVKTMRKNLPKELFWGLSRHGSYLYMMFDEHYDGYERYYNAFLHFFKKRTEYLQVEQRSRSIRRVHRSRNDDDNFDF